MQIINHNKHRRSNTSAAIQSESHSRKGNKRNLDPDAEFSKYKNVGTGN